MTETATIQKVLNGDVNAFASIIDTYKDLALTLAYNIVLNKEDAEEIVQDSFVKAYKSLAGYKGDAKFSTWFYRIVVNTALNKNKRKKLFILSIEEPVAENFAFDLPALDLYRTTEQKKFIKEAIKGLTENERVCITMHYLNELSIDEIKELTGITASNIKVLLFRGRKKLYQHLQKLLKEELNNLI